MNTKKTNNVILNVVKDLGFKIKRFFSPISSELRMTAGKTQTIILVGLAVSAILAVFVSQFASNSPDGLEKVAGDKGFLSLG